MRSQTPPIPPSSTPRCRIRSAEPSSRRWLESLRPAGPPHPTSCERWRQSKGIPRHRLVASCHPERSEGAEPDRHRDQIGRLERYADVPHRSPAVMTRPTVRFASVIALSLLGLSLLGLKLPGTARAEHAQLAVL